jgi:dihydroorotate dehydrogenase (fumarate)
VLERLEAAGAGAVVLPSLFEEDILGVAFTHHEMLSRGSDAFGEAQSYLPEIDVPDPVDVYLDLVRDATDRLSIPVIASLNGTTGGGWVRYAAEIEQAGAAAIELNVYLVASDPGDDARHIEEQLSTLVREVRSATSVPIAVKLSPFFTAVGDVAERLVDAGADGLVLFNRFYQPDFDLESLSVVPSLDLSTSADLRLPLRWIGMLRDRLGCSLALSSGVDQPADVVKGLLAGADVVMTTSSLLRHGPDHLGTLRAGAAAWFDEHEYESVGQARGSMRRGAVREPDAYERANYVATLRSAAARW